MKDGEHLMDVAVIGLGKMGQAIVYRLHKAGVNVVGFDPDVKAQEKAAAYGARIVKSLEECSRVSVVWLMIPAGDLIDTVLKKLIARLKKKSIIIDGGNSHFTDSVRRAQMLQDQGFFFIDCGTSGGLAGRTRGFSLMLGGDKGVIEKLDPLFKALAAPRGYAYLGPSGAGHYVKMVHNGIEYALLQSYAEGFHLLHDGAYKDLNLETVSRIWLHGSIIRSWILNLTHAIFKRDQNFDSVSGAVQESGMGAWTVQEAHKQKIPTVLLQDALELRAWSRKTGGNYATKLVALLRHQFGGHRVLIKKIKKRKIR